jgi:hypothetical protein
MVIVLSVIAVDCGSDPWSSHDQTKDYEIGVNLLLLHKAYSF